MSPPASAMFQRRGEVGIDDETRLYEMGYRPELKRSFSRFGIIGFAFSVLTCWTALAGSLQIAISAGGPPVIIYSWITICAFSLTVAYSFAEISSAFPIAGGQYSWTAMLSPHAYRRPLSYACGWLVVTGFLSAGAANGILAANLLLGMFQLSHPLYIIQRWHTCVLCWILLAVAASINIVGRAVLDRLGRLMMVFNILSFVVVITAILVMDDHKRSARFVFLGFQNTTGFGNAYAALQGILQAAWGMTGYDAAAHMVEELHDAKTIVPQAIVAPVWVGAVTGLIFLVAAMFCMDETATAGHNSTEIPLLTILEQATSSVISTIALSSLIATITVASLWFLTAQSSRVIYAFARDDGLPWSHWVKQVRTKDQTPVNAIVVVFGVNASLLLVYIATQSGFNTVLAVSTEAFYLSYAMPIVLRVWHRQHISRELDTAWPLGRLGLTVNLVAIFYLLFAIVTFNLPATHPITPGNMNYTSAELGVIFFVAWITWLLFARARYTGPAGRVNNDL
ncbi:hypothetical protein LTR86_011269 [Recurvomyces mirabilis]|nr:hypothetical protein LTR86_011269 [Recurvomyces mirabilis]